MNHLAADAFLISEDGVPQTVALFNREDVSVVISLLIDTKTRAGDVDDAAAGLVKRLRARDTAVVIDFVSTPNAFSNALRARALPSATPNVIRRHAVVLVTDGETELDPSVLLAARGSNTAVYVVAFLGDHPLDEAREPAFSLRRLASSTGGRAFFPADRRRLSSLYNQIYEELRQQYTIGYISTNARRDGSWRNVTVGVNRPDASARSKQGYFAPDR